MPSYFLLIVFYLIIYVFLAFFCLKLLVKIIIEKVIGHIYKYDQRNWPYPSPNTTFVIPPRFYIYIKPNVTVLMVPLWVKMMYNYLDQIKAPNIMVIWMAKIMTIHSYMRHLKKIIAILPLLVIQSPPQPHHDCPHYIHLENNIYVFKLRVNVPMHHNALNQEH